MGALPSILRLARRMLQVAGDTDGRHSVQNRAVKEESAAPSSLGVSGNFPFADCKIADATEGGGRLPWMKGSGDPFQNESIGAANAREIRMQREWHHQRIGETTRPLQDGPASAGAPQNLDGVLFAGGDIDIVDEPA